MKKLTWTILVVFLVFADPVTAQFYRYIDQNGNLRFTDDYTKVPEGQRGNVLEYKESKNGPDNFSKESLTKEQKSIETGAVARGNQTVDVATKSNDGTISLKEFRVRIEKMKEQLEGEYQTLVKEKDTLVQKRNLTKNQEELVAYNELVDAFNQRAEKYEQMSGKLSKLVDEYNSIVLEKNAKLQKP